jgi:hypothetical protein
MRKAVQFDARRPTSKEVEKPFSEEAFVEGKDPNAPDSERQNLWIPSDLRQRVKLRCVERRETISAFAVRAFERELSEPAPK